MATLPFEILVVIVEICANYETSALLEPLDPTSDFPLVALKPSFDSLRGLSTACRWLHTTIQKLWFRILYVRELADWDIALKLSVCDYVREIRVISASLTEATPRAVFSRFSHLHTAFVDVHNDFIPNSMSTLHNRPFVPGRYQILTACMPRSLRRLWIVNAHGPDAMVIRGLSSNSPELEELSISRCTLFGPRLRNQSRSDHADTCKHWDLFPGDHESYFSGEGVQEYAESLLRELKPLAFLNKLHMGLYLTPHGAIEQHQGAHVGSHSETSARGTSCSECLTAYGDQTKAAEIAANQILFDALPNLTEISWASFFTNNRTGSVLYVRPRAAKMCM